MGCPRNLKHPTSPSPNGELTVDCADTGRKQLLLSEGSGIIERFRYLPSQQCWQRRVRLMPIRRDADCGEMPFRLAGGGTIVLPEAKPCPWVLSAENALIVNTPQQTIISPEGVTPCILSYQNVEPNYKQYVFLNGRWHQQTGARLENHSEENWADILRPFSPGQTSMQMGQIEILEAGRCVLQTLNGPQAFADGERVDLALDPYHHAYRVSGFGNWLEIVRSDQDGGGQQILLTLAFYQSNWRQLVPHSGTLETRYSFGRHFADYGPLVGPVIWAIHNAVRLPILVLQWAVTILLRPQYLISLLIRKFRARTW